MMEFWVYTDGACSGNPGPGGWAFALCARESSAAGLVVEGVGHEAHTTNNRMEMEAALRALNLLSARWPQESARNPVRIFTDSSLLIRGMTQWLSGWKRKNWIKSDGSPVSNKDLWERLDESRKLFSRLEWLYVPGHSGISGNERVDALAVGSCGGVLPSAFEGPLAEYEHRAAFTKEPPVEDLSTPSVSGAKSSKKEVYYLSYVGGKLERHTTWADCEKRVKGVPGAKFKKVSSSSEEGAILASWGIRS
jgi:ribonuclease HI